VEQRTVIKFLFGENVPSAEIHHRLQQQYGEECLLRRPRLVWELMLYSFWKSKTFFLCPYTLRATHIILTK